MAARVTVLLFLLSVFCVQCEYLFKKLCDDANSSHCTVYNVILDPCADGGRYCTVKKTKRYILSVDFLPSFSANKLNLSMYGADSNTGVFDKVIKGPADACDLLTCPVEQYTRRLFDIPITFPKTLAEGKQSIKVKMSNRDNEKQVCCFTFNVKVRK